MDDQDFLGRAEHFARRLAGAGKRLDEASFGLLVRILGGVNDALVRRGGAVDVPLAESERRLLTPQLGRELQALLGALGPAAPAERLCAETTRTPPPSALRPPPDIPERTDTCEGDGP
ncbi:MULTISPECIES: hypothetical protein [Streptomycetaceae]|uniref:Uncharacterized protein n=1 Tax=Streptantibioticus cattleyicolor (strain ATCC 35852 / DSM 46488 / JCM 4925 / NBRC 14057 / NRRL 8057) TaxID=1003195 RepID=F8K538_STREN|nr:MULTISPECIES: hypothetical protein [Streptomycetaceae]AEW96506.1 hypothetical protein SCATT_41350 [Streptantibioticus cattleyicolor NRRL 8057 = DSM 46488]MYS61008.1 hypothetical protein [Streptomyces sp. SID5468]CCB76842.1 protein of unknown function [Streptantibioticus cattleyicolor NRRL 8057 = DSM 46488]